MSDQRSLYWEDFTVGAMFDSASRTVTEEDVLAFARLTGDWNALHVDAEFARRGPFGRQIAHGLLVLSLAAGLGDREGLLDKTIVAFLGMEWRFLAPVFLGDTIRQRRTVREKRETKRSDRGIIIVEVQVLNQEDAVVQEGTRTIMVRRRPAESDRPEGSA